MQRCNLNIDDIQVRDLDQIEKAAAALFSVGDDFVLEFRIPEIGERRRTVSGYFDGQHQREFVEVAAHWSGQAIGIYVSLNHVTPDALARAANRAKDFARFATKTEDIIRRAWLLVDLDPKKKLDGVSASDSEHNASLARAREIRADLSDLGWPLPMFNDSGNGAHLFYRINLPNDANATTLVNAVLSTLAAKFSDSTVMVDTGVGDAPRIVKVPGTLVCKGDHTAERPHRIARIIDLPERLEIVSREKLEQLVGAATMSADRAPMVADGNLPCELLFPAIDVKSWLEKHGFAIRREKPYADGGRLFELELCPWRREVKEAGKTYVIQFANGNIHVACHHKNKCKGKGWHELLDLVEPGWRVAKCNSLGTKSASANATPHNLARRFLEKRYGHADGPTLVNWRDEWHRWRHGAWRPVTPPTIRAELTQFLEPDQQLLGDAERDNCPMPKFTVNLLNNVIAALQGVALLSPDLNQPGWLNDAQPWPAHEVLAARNGLFHLPSGDSGFLPPTPRFFSSVAVDYDFDINAAEPSEWLKFVHWAWPDDKESIELLQDWMGYLLTQDTSQQKILLVIGPPRSGKGTIVRVINQLIGAANVASPTLNSLSTTFGLSALLGKSLATINDARLDSRADRSILERLISVSGEDSITVDRKFRELETARLRTRFMIVSNELPELLDASGAFPSRILLLQMTNSALGNEDPTLTDRLCKELPGILNWSRVGWLRLRERGRFIQPESSKPLLRELHDLSSPIKDFVAERGELGEYEIPKGELYDGYLDWCASRGIRFPWSPATFGKNLFAAYPQILSRQPSAGDGKKMPRVYAGIRLRK